MPMRTLSGLTGYTYTCVTAMHSNEKGGWIWTHSTENNGHGSHVYCCYGAICVWGIFTNGFSHVPVGPQDQQLMQFAHHACKHFVPPLTDIDLLQISIKVSNDLR